MIHIFHISIMFSENMGKTNFVSLEYWISHNISLLPEMTTIHLSLDNGCIKLDNLGEENISFWANTDTAKTLIPTTNPRLWMVFMVYSVWCLAEYKLFPMWLMLIVMMLLNEIEWEREKERVSQKVFCQVRKCLSVNFWVNFYSQFVSNCEKEDQQYSFRILGKRWVQLPTTLLDMFLSKFGFREGG